MTDFILVLLYVFTLNLFNYRMNRCKNILCQDLYIKKTFNVKIILGIKFQITSFQKSSWFCKKKASWFWWFCFSLYY